MQVLLIKRANFNAHKQTNIKHICIPLRRRMYKWKNMPHTENDIQKHKVLTQLWCSQIVFVRKKKTEDILTNNTGNKTKCNLCQEENVQILKLRDSHQLLIVPTDLIAKGKHQCNILLSHLDTDTFYDIPYQLPSNKNFCA